jgi:anaphase-promoting complex subunit 1
MAQVQSLGLYEPSALPYLIAESILPAEPSSDLYSWHTYGVLDEEGREIAEEEVLTTRQCVVWSQSRVVRRVYNLDNEGEAILQAFVTSFPTTRQASASGQETRLVINAGLPTIPRRLPNSSKTGTQLPSTLKERPDKQGHRSYIASEPTKETSERALVVILRSKAHIYYLSGDSHIIPLPFEVGSAWPTTPGFLLQRRLSTIDNEISRLDEPFEPLAASRSYHASRLLHLPKSDINGAPRPALTVTASSAQVWQMPATPDESMPRTFSFTQPHSELGLVTVNDPRQTSTFNSSRTGLHCRFPIPPGCSAATMLSALQDDAMISARC